MKWLSTFLIGLTFLLNNPNPTFAEKEIVINLWTRSLKLQDGEKVIKAYKISPGSRDTPTPMGIFKIVNKSKNWGSGFGTRWMEINVPWGMYGIHGTNQPGLIGWYVSHGCIRMRNKEVEELYKQVKIGTKVTIDGPLTGHKDLTYRILVLGSKGTLVQMVQNRLKSAGYYKGVCHGKFDRLTEIAVIRFQKDYKLPVTMQIHYNDLVHLGIIE